MDFASIRHHKLRSATLMFAEQLMANNVAFSREGQIYDSPGRDATNYELEGSISTSPKEAAEFIARMHRTDNTQTFDMVLLNRKAEGVYLADLLQAFRDTLGQPPARLVNHFCRPTGDNAPPFYASDNFIRT